MELRNFILKALSTGATELVLAPGEAARYRVEKEWLSFEDRNFNEVISPAITRKWTLEICTESARKALVDQGQAQGFWELQNQKLFFEVIQSRSGYLIQLQWIPAEWREASFWNFPRWVQESLWRGRGLHLVVSPDPRALDAATETLVQNMNTIHKSWIVWLKNESLSHLKSEQSLITFHNAVPTACDVLVVEGSNNIDLAINESEKGRAVILLLRHYSMLQSMEQIMKQCGGDRLAGQLRLAMSLRTIFGMTDWVAAYDLLANTPLVEEMLRKNQISGLENVMRESEKDTGMRTLNQSLLQLMIRRKIDFKKGFSLSSAPQELDALLKKVGI
jgi:Tfp pilus assembly pilus retraction ATPase PilT